jgi:glycosyltransferase involved in cell wall biosynthesis
MRKKVEDSTIVTTSADVDVKTPHRNAGLRISIVTICRDNPEELKETCASVDEQQRPAFEHIIIDGSTRPEIRRWLNETPQPSHRIWVSEPDEGISDAFNKGVGKATGDLVQFLNAGDRLHDSSVLSQVAEAFTRDPSLRWLHGSLRMMRGGLWVVIGKPFDPERLYRGMRSTFHPTMYVRRELFQRHGGFDKSLKIAMDYDFLCRIAKERNTFLDKPLVVFEPEGVSDLRYLDGLEEMQLAYGRYFGFSVRQRVWKWRQVLLFRLLKSGLGQWMYALKVRLGWENR